MQSLDGEVPSMGDRFPRKIVLPDGSKYYPFSTDAKTLLREGFRQVHDIQDADNEVKEATTARKLAEEAFVKAFVHEQSCQIGLKCAKQCLSEMLETNKETLTCAFFGDL